MADVTSPSPLAAARRDALTLRGTGDLRAARDLLERAVTAARPTYGDDHPDVLSTRHALARLHREAGDLAGARRVLEAALAAGEPRNAAEPVLLGIAFDLGTMAEMRGDVDEASRHFGRVARYGPQALGPDHWAVRAATDYLDGGDSEITRPITSFTPRPGPVPRREEPPKHRPSSLADLPEGAVLRVDPTPVSAPPGPVSAPPGPWAAESWADGRPTSAPPGPWAASAPTSAPPGPWAATAPTAPTSAPPGPPGAAVPISSPPGPSTSAGGTSPSATGPAATGASPAGAAVTPPDPWTDPEHWADASRYADPDRWADLRGDAGHGPEPSRFEHPDRWADLRGEPQAAPSAALPAAPRATAWEEYRPTTTAPSRSRTGTTVRVVGAVLAGVAATAAVAWYLATGELPGLP